MISDMMSVDRKKMKQLTAEIDKHKKEIMSLTTQLSKASVAIKSEESRGNSYKRKFIETEQSLVEELLEIRILDGAISSSSYLYGIRVSLFVSVFLLPHFQ